MLSLRESAACLGVSHQPLSALRHFLGYSTAPVNDSLGLQMRRLQNRHIHANVIRVGWEQFTPAEEAEIDAAVRFTRNNYAAVNLGVGRIEHWFISTADARGRDVINSDSEAHSLTDEWTIYNHALDMFIVRLYVSDTAGLSDVDGDCDKSDSKWMTGSVVEILFSGDPTVSVTGQVFAHEACHYLGNAHRDDPSALMNPTVPNGGLIDPTEAEAMLTHCFAVAPC